MPCEDFERVVHLAQKAIVVEKNAEDSISSTVPCKAAPECGAKTGERLLPTEEDIDTITDALCSVLLLYVLDQSKEEAHALFKGEALLEAKKYKIKASVGANAL